MYFGQTNCLCTFKVSFLVGNFFAEDFFLRRSDLRRYFLRNRYNFQRKHVKKRRNSKRFARKRIAFGKLTLIVNVQLLLILFFSFVFLFLCLFIGGFFRTPERLLQNTLTLCPFPLFFPKPEGEAQIIFSKHKKFQTEISFYVEMVCLYTTYV